MAKYQIYELPEGCTIEQAYEIYPPEGLTVYGYSKHRTRFNLPGKATTNINRALGMGTIHKNEHDKIDPREADTAWVANTDQGCNSDLNGRARRRGRPEPQAIPEYAVSRARREHAKALLDELKLEEQRGLLVNKAEVDAALFGISRNVRDLILNIPVRVADIIAGMGDPSDIEDLLEKEFEDVLSGFAAECKNFSGIKRRIPIEEPEDDE